MQIVNPSIEILKVDLNPLQLLETAGRTCYKSEDKITEDSAAKFIQMILDRGHETVIEHCGATVRFICDRGVSHELVRHRIATFSQESTRYVNYSKKGMQFIKPCFLPEDCDDFKLWERHMADCEKQYNIAIACGWKPEEARALLPNSLKTEVVMTCNFREWRLFFKQRTSKFAHPQMREVAIPLLKEMQKCVPVIFDGIGALI